MDPAEPESEQLCQEVDPEEGNRNAMSFVSDAVPVMFSDHIDHLREARRLKISTLQLKNVVEGQSTRSQITTGEIGARLPSDVYEGDTVLRTLNKLLSMVDDRGYQRSSQQLRFHQAFIRATSRVIYRADWSKDAPKIQRAQQWESCPSEVLISTPRRFGKTFS